MQFITQKKCCLLLAFITFNTFISAQSFQKKDAIGSFGIGVPHLNKAVTRYDTQQEDFKKSFHGAIQSSVKGLNPLCLKYEYALSKNFSLGLSLAWYTIDIHVVDSYTVSNGSSHVEDTYDYHLSSIAFGLRPNYHIPLKALKSDFFVGCAFGFSKNALSINVSSTATNFGGFADIQGPTGIYIAPTVGYRYYFANNLAFNAEAGYERGAVLELGLAFRFRPFHYEQPR